MWAIGAALGAGGAEEKGFAWGEAFERGGFDLAGESEERRLVSGGDQSGRDVVRFLKVVDRDGDVGAFDRIVVDADGPFEVRRVFAGRRVAVDGRQALRDVGRAAAGVERE